MKTIKFLIVILLFAVNLQAQNVEPTQRPFDYKGNPNYLIDASNPEFKQTKFVIGGAWSSDSMTAKIMLYNMGNTVIKFSNQFNYLLN